MTTAGQAVLEANNIIIYRPAKKWPRMKKIWRLSVNLVVMTRVFLKRIKKEPHTYIHNIGNKRALKIDIDFDFDSQ